MPIGHHIARCFHCGKEWQCGDCIPSMCDECEAAGHTGVLTQCRACVDRPTAKPALTPPVDLVDQIVALRAEVSNLKRICRDASSDLLAIMRREPSLHDALRGVARRDVDNVRIALSKAGEIGAKS